MLLTHWTRKLGTGVVKLTTVLLEAYGNAFEWCVLLKLDWQMCVHGSHDWLAQEAKL